VSHERTVSLTVVAATPAREPHEHFRLFGSRKYPLRPSKLIQFVRCPMSAFLSMTDDEGVGGQAADTGNLVHAAAAVYHRLKADGVSDAKRLEAGLAELDAAREKFPAGDAAKAAAIFRSYAADPENSQAETPWVEEKVRIELAPAPHDPTGEPVVIVGTLDQVRRHPNRRMKVHDIKTGSGKDATETVAEYLVQQAAYTLAARECLDGSIESGSIIYTPGYEKPRGRRHLPLNLSVEQCRLLLVPVVYAIAEIRRGVPAFRPGADSCKYCPVRPYTNCLSMFQGVYR
jgi:hypothetical protein